MSSYTPILLDWVPLSTYCAVTQSETPDAVDGRVRSGHWINGVHVRKPEGSRQLWVNLRAVEDWAQGKTPAHNHGKGK